MSRETVIVVRCDKCHKLITGRLTVKKCPCCQADICLACFGKTEGKGSKPSKPEPQAPEQQAPEQQPEQFSIRLRGVSWGGPSRQQAVAGFEGQAVTEEHPITPEERGQIDAFLEQPQ